MSNRQLGLSRLDRIKEALRSYWMGPIMSSDPRARDFFGGSPTSTGVSVDEFSAMNYSAVYAAVQLISSQVGNLPLVLYKKEKGGGKTRYDGHPLYRLVHDRPNPEMSSLVWRESLQAHVLTWGNLYSEIQRNGEGRPVALWPITPDRVTPFRRGSDTPLEYRVVNRDGADEFIPAADMIHVPGLGYNGICGYSVIAKMRESIGLGLAAERFGGTFFGNGASFGGVISYEGPRPPELSDKNYRDSINSQHQGVDRAHKFLALYNGAKYARLGIPPNDAQFLETRQFQVDEIARWFNLPPHKLKELMRSTNNNIEHQNLEYYIDCLSPWLERWEQELCEKLISPLERNQQEIEFVVDGLLRGDVASRGEFHSKQFNIGGLTPNDVRQIENRNPLAGGEDAFVALNLIPLKLAVPYYEALIDSTKAKAEADRRPPPEPKVVAPPPSNGPTREEFDKAIEERDRARKVAQEVEDAKDLAAVESAAALATEKAERAADSERLTSEAVRIAQDLGKAVADLTDARAAVGTEAERANTSAAALSASAAAVEELRIQVATLTENVTAGVSDVVSVRVDLARAELLRTEATEACKAAEEVAMVRGGTIATLEMRLEESAKAVVAERALWLVERDQERATALERIAALEAEGQRLTEARTHADEVNQATVTELRGQIDAVTQEHLSAETALLEATTKLADVEAVHLSDRSVWEAEAQRLTEARTHADEVNGATVTELRGQIASVSQELAAATTALLEARTVIGTLEATRDSQRDQLANADQEVARQASHYLTLQTRISETQAAIRGTVVDAVSRLVAKESDRARGAQGTPAKLAKWVETFYPMHEDFCRVALKPAVRAMLIANGVDASVERVLDRIVLAHVSESTRQLQGVLHDTDADSLSPALERVLRRWEAERAESFADRILKEVA